MPLVCNTFGGPIFLSVRKPSKPHSVAPASPAYLFFAPVYFSFLSILSSLRLLCKRALFGFDSYPIKLIKRKKKKKTFFLPFCCCLVSSLQFSSVTMQYTKLFFSSFQAVALFSTRKTLLSSLNDCEAIKQLSEDAGGLLKLIQKARNLARNSCIAVALNRPFPSWSKPLFQSDAKCKAVDMKRIIQYSHANKTNFHMKGFALSLVLKVRGFRTWSI